MTSLRLCVAVFAVLSSPLCVFAAAPPRYLSHDAYLCQVAGQSTTSADLLAYLRQRCASPDDARRAEKLIDQLGDDDYQTRQAATRELEALGIVALPVLRKHKNHADLDVKRSIAWLLLRMAPLENLGRNLGAPLSRSVVRLLAKSDEAGVAETLMRYLPFADCPETEEAVYYALDELHSRGVAGRVLTTALGDTSAARRALAACLLAKSGDAKLRAAGKSMLKDRAALVRLRVAQGMLAAKTPDRDALPALIELLRDESHEVTWQAEELLRYAVGRWMPAEVVGHNTPAERERCYKAWMTWWKEWEKDIDLTRLHYSRRRPGLMMAYLPAHEDKETHDRVALYGCDGVPRYTMEMPRLPDLPRGAMNPVAFRPSGELLTLRLDEGKQAFLLVQHGLDGKPKWERAMPEKEYRALYFARLRIMPEGRCLIWASNWIGETDEIGHLLRRAGSGVASRSNVSLSASGHQWITSFDSSQSPRNPKPDDMPPIEATFPVGRNEAWTGGEREWLQFAGANAVWDGGLDILASGEMYAQVYGRAYRAHIAEYDREGRRVRDYRQAGSVIAKLANGNIVMLGGGAREITLDGRTVWHAIADRGINQAAVVLPLVRFGFDRPGDAKSFDLDTPAEWARALSDERVLVRQRAMNSLYGHVRWSRKDFGSAVNYLRLWSRQPERCPVSDEILRFVIERLRDSDQEVSRWAEELLWEVQWFYKDIPDLAIPYLIERMAAGKGGYSSTLLRYSGAKAVQPLIDIAFSPGLKHQSKASLRGHALSILVSQAIRLRDHKAINAVQRGLRDESEIVFNQLLDEIGRLSPGVFDMSPHYLARRGERYSLPAATVFLPDLMRLAESKDDTVFNKAAKAIGAMGDAAGEAVPLMLLMSRKTGCRVAAIRCLGCIGGHDPRVLPFLLKCLDRREDVLVRSAAVDSIALFGPRKEVLDALIKALDDRQVDKRLNWRQSVRGDAVRHLAWFGDRAKSAIPAVLAVVLDKTESIELRQSAITTLASVGGKSIGAKLSAIARDSSQDEKLREKAAWGLYRLDSTAGKLLRKDPNAAHLLPSAIEYDESKLP